VPKISAPTVAQHRELRRGQLIAAAADLALEVGGAAVTMSAVAQRAGISRTAAYEYFGSSTDLLAELVIDELALWAKTLDAIVSSESDPEAKVRAWIRGALGYVADGRHLLVKALSAVSLPQERSHEIGVAHRRLVDPLVDALRLMGVADPAATAFLVNATVESATRRIERGLSAENEIASAESFALAGVREHSR
jgi:AcrR family transcriptional regulator